MITLGIEVRRGRGATPEELVEPALNKLMTVGNNAPQPIRDQAFAFREKLRGVLLHLAREAAFNERATCAGMITRAGHPEIARALMKGKLD